MGANSDMSIGIVIQARMQSTRLPGKVLLPFWDGEPILGIQIRNIKSAVDAPVIVAIPRDASCDPLEEFVLSRGAECFRGDEQDVLERFIGAAELNGLSGIVRVCSDNPFLDMASLAELLATARRNPGCDYVSFNVAGRPSILTHFGFWAEYVGAGALRRVRELTAERLYHEHVTNYVYTHPDSFSIHWIEVPEEVAAYSDIRLTIDTAADMDICRKVYGAVTDNGTRPSSLSAVLAYLEGEPEIRAMMRKQINQNAK